MVIIYNRVPKTGSTSFVGIAYELYAKNSFHVLHFNVSRNKHVLSIADQVNTDTHRPNETERSVYRSFDFFMPLPTVA